MVGDLCNQGGASCIQIQSAGSGCSDESSAAAPRVEIVKCCETTQILGDRVEGTLSPLQRWRLRLHLWFCRNCRNYLFSYMTTLRAEKAAYREVSRNPAVEAPDALVNLIVSAAKRTRGGDSARGRNEEEPDKH
jgi:Putative zinc-finger